MTTASPARPIPRPLVSVFTATWETGEDVESAYRSLLRQTYPDWEWVVVDDSETSSTADIVGRLADSGSAHGRVRLYRQHPSTGSIGANKAAAAALARGELLVELDHDDELAPEALELVVAAFGSHPDVDFIYSDFVDWLDAGEADAGPALYPDGWAFGFGAYASELIDGRRVPVGLSPPITAETIRHIVAAPNHVRAWRTPFYRRIGGHNPKLPVADDYELVVRTFLEGTTARIPRPLYVQHHSPLGTNASRLRNPEIQDRVGQIAAQYEPQIAQRLLSLGLTSSRSTGSPWVDPEPIRIANAVTDPVAEAAADLGQPLVSVVIPTYRRPELLRRALTSVLTQSYPNLEVLIVGDCCPFLDNVITEIDDDRVRHWNLPVHYGDSGAAPRNYALKAMARGTLIAYLDDDNEWSTDHLQSLVACLASNPEASFAFSSIDIDGECVTFWRPRRYQVDTSALLHRRLLLDRFGYWRSPSDVGYAHDWELVSRWKGEPWVASLESTLRYTLRDAPARQQELESIRRVADEEARRRSGDPHDGASAFASGLVARDRFPPEGNSLPSPDSQQWHHDTSAQGAVRDFVGSLIRLLEPDFVVETGAGEGWTSIEIGEALAANGHGEAEVLEIDPRASERVRRRVGLLPVQVVASESLTYGPRRDIDFAFLDSSLEIRHLELRHLARFLSPRAVVVINDTAPDQSPGGLLDELGARCVRFELRTPRGLTMLQFGSEDE